ncbi:MAG: DUF2877 domain-containing protein [Clostridiales bacterium]|nr:DUF2877 domain-containing protein [Clostridiales bacterium]
MRIIVASDDFDQVFKSGYFIGRVHSVFNNVINLKINDEMLTIGNVHISIGPKTALVNENINFLDLKIQQNMVVKKRNNEIMIEELDIKFIYQLREIWNSYPELDYIKISTDELHYKMNCLERIIFTNGDSDSISPIIFDLRSDFKWLADIEAYPTGFTDKHMNFIVGRIKNLLNAVEKDLWEDVDNLAKSVIGFGPGLTPASDDFVLGLMTGLLYSSRNYMRDIKSHQHFIKLINGRTTDVSYEGLVNASRGKVNQVVKEAVLSILSNCSSEVMTDKVDKLIEIGQTSGTDILTGIFVGIKFNVNKGEF